jgi:hypothetical protein
MTWAEACHLKRGMYVEFIVWKPRGRRDRRIGKILSTKDFINNGSIRIEQTLPKPKGRSYVLDRDVELIVGAVNVEEAKNRAHIYADYLEEHGEQTAADMLRKAFPME